MNTLAQEIIRTDRYGAADTLIYVLIAVCVVLGLCWAIAYALGRGGAPATASRAVWIVGAVLLVIVLVLLVL